MQALLYALLVVNINHTAMTQPIKVTPTCNDLDSLPYNAQTCASG